jgi:hypothetical protein
MRRARNRRLIRSRRARIPEGRTSAIILPSPPTRGAYLSDEMVERLTRTAVLGTRDGEFAVELGGALANDQKSRDWLSPLTTPRLRKYRFTLEGRENYRGDVHRRATRISEGAMRKVISNYDTRALTAR